MPSSSTTRSSLTGGSLRVTVNHIKEFFTIINLNVTGEWDRRGHGGVRGPYVYGLAKKSLTLAGAGS